jgi:hypothetical protein
LAILLLLRLTEFLTVFDGISDLSSYWENGKTKISYRTNFLNFLNSSSEENEI